MADSREASALGYSSWFCIAPKERKYIQSDGQLSPGAMFLRLRSGGQEVAPGGGGCFSGDCESALISTWLPCSASDGHCEQPGVNNGVPSLTGGSAAKGAGFSLAEGPGSKF